MTVLVIDNYDSFTYNLVQIIGGLGKKVVVRRNDQICAAQAKRIEPSHIVISPGPGYPVDAGVSKEIITRFARFTPILGVCLGHQCVAESMGGQVRRGEKPIHGKTSPIFHDGRGIFSGIPNPFSATRYHSLVVEPQGLPSDLEVVARTDQAEIMALRHIRYPLWGVQFHPESILTAHGSQLVANFLAL